MASMPPVGGEEQSVKQLRKFSISTREARVEDAQALGVIAFDAFKAFHDSVGEDYRMSDFPSIEVSVELIRGCLEGPEKAFYGVAAVKHDTGQPIGSGYLHHVGFNRIDSDVYSIGPISVDPAQVNMGVGRAVMTSLIHRAKQEGATSIRLTQAASNTRSFALYLSLGFIPKDCFAVFSGTVAAERVEAAASAVGLALRTDGVVRLMEEADVASCAQLFKETNGYDRSPDIERCLGPHAWVVTSKDGEILGYTTGFAWFAHACARNESDFITLFHGITKNVQMNFILHLSTRRYPKLAQWALAARLRLQRHHWYMVIGDYQAPKDNGVYFPSALH